jgi:tetratricopeptide (TPR) repeat protein
MQFDRTPQDLFAVQDEIAIDVARALMLSIDTKASQKLANRGTNHVEAWLAYLQGRALLQTRKAADLERAKERLTEAIRLDPSFASGYVALAEAHLLEEYFRYPEFWFLKGALMSPEGRAEIEQLLARALSLDESNGEAYLVRAWLQQDYLQAEADYRRGLALSPNNASGYERFAKLLFFFPGQGGITPDGTPDPAKRSEAFAMIDRARALDPLVPGGHLTKAIMTLWGRGDDEATNALLLQSLEQDPNYYPALVHLAEFLWCCQGEYAEAIRYGEQALALEPGASWPQRSLVHFYLDVGEPETARQILEESKEPNRFGWIPLYLYERDWQKAGEVAFTPGIGIWGLDMYSTIRAISQYFHATGDSKLARGPLEFVSRVQWDVQGAPTLGDDMIPDQSATIALAAILLSTGDRAHARRLLQEVVREAGRQERVYGVSNKFYGMPNPQALALLGEREATIKVLQRTLDNGYLNDWWYQLERDPAYDGMRDDPRFKAILAKMKRHAADQHERLSAMRAAGLVPTRGSTRNPRPSQP